MDINISSIILNEVKAINALQGVIVFKPFILAAFFFFILSKVSAQTNQFEIVKDSTEQFQKCPIGLDPNMTCFKKQIKKIEKTCQEDYKLGCLYQAKLQQDLLTTLKEIQGVAYLIYMKNFDSKEIERNYEKSCHKEFPLGCEEYAKFLRIDGQVEKAKNISEKYKINYRKLASVIMNENNLPQYMKEARELSSIYQHEN